MIQMAPESPGPGGTLLIYAPVPLYREGETLFVEEQASNGIRLWASNFSRVIVMMPLSRTRPRGSWISVDQAALDASRIRLIELPSAYRPDVFLRELPQTVPIIRKLIREADYLSFAIGGLFGDWGAVAAIAAYQMGRPYAVWTDRVESEVVRRTSGQGSLKSRLRARLTHRPMAWLERFVIRRAALGLFHGRETFDAYAPFSPNPHVVHDIHVKKSDHLGADDVAAKIAACREGPLKIAYAGRADAMKAPLDWIAALEQLAKGGIDFRAVWLGDGDLHKSLVNRIELSGLGDRVKAPGFVSDRGAVLRTMRESHVFLFCHTTPESPRCLIEALVSACPLVGYRSVFAQDLVSSGRGGLLVPVGDVDELAANLALLATDRRMLGKLIGGAAADGEPFDDETVFRHRSELIKSHLPPNSNPLRPSSGPFVPARRSAV
jgi:colanic acid/amylovoran biosynthesis glycosyltransferase